MLDQKPRHYGKNTARGAKPMVAISTGVKMQDRIKQLAQQAGMYVDVKGEPWPKWMGAEECELAYQKFAELIVEECTTVIDRTLFQNIGWNTSRAVRRHFGIEDEE
jgi:hypothetical protein